MFSDHLTSAWRRARTGEPGRGQVPVRRARARPRPRRRWYTGQGVTEARAGAGRIPARPYHPGACHTVGVRVAEIARLTGTTVRTVRYYHSLGLLPVPPERGGWRDYELAHVARLSRIRWLVTAGVPLAAVGRIIERTDPPTGPGGRAPGADHRPGARQPGAGRPGGRAEPASGAGGAADVTRAAPGAEGASATKTAPDTEEASATDPVVEDLAGALEAAQAHLAEVTRQRDMLAGLLERARQGMTVSPMPTAMVSFFDRLEAAAPDERTRAAVRRERDVTDLACYRGQMPPQAEALFHGPDPLKDAEALAAYGQDPACLSDEEVARRAGQAVGRLESYLDAALLRQLARTVDEDLVRSFFRLLAAVDSSDDRVTAALEEQFFAAIRRWREPAP